MRLLCDHFVTKSLQPLCDQSKHKKEGKQMVTVIMVIGQWPVGNQGQTLRDIQWPITEYSMNDHWPITDWSLTNCWPVLQVMQKWQAGENNSAGVDIEKFQKSLTQVVAIVKMAVVKCWAINRWPASEQSQWCYGCWVITDFLVTTMPPLSVTGWWWFCNC